MVNQKPFIYQATLQFSYYIERIFSTRKVFICAIHIQLP